MDYVVVHAYGILQIVDKPEWLRAQLKRLPIKMSLNFQTLGSYRCTC